MACPVKLLILFVLNCLGALIGAAQGVEGDSPGKLTVVPHDRYPYLVMEEEERDLVFNLNYSYPRAIRVRVESTEPSIAEVHNQSSAVDPDGSSSNFTVKVKGLFLGRTFLKLFFDNTKTSPDDQQPQSYDKNVSNQSETWDWYEMPEKYEVAVGRKEGALSHSFTGTIIILVCLANVAMGCKTDLQVIKETMKKPIAPLTGLFSQFVLMPLISLAVVYALKFDPVNGLGFFAMGCSPGGAASNAYTYLLAGDVSLSVTMTFCSTLAALGLFPLWLFTVGTRVIYRTDVQIPYQNIMFSLIGLIIPVAIGILLQKKLPRVAKYVVMAIRPIMIIFFILVFTVGVYANLYIFALMRDKPEILLAGALVPYLGFLFGGGMGLLSQQSWKRTRTIAIETGIQNTGIAIVLLKISLPPPDNDLSIVAPIASAIFTPIPMLVAIIGREIYIRCYKGKEAEFALDERPSSETRASESEGEVKYENVDGIGSDDEMEADLKENNNKVPIPPV